MELIVEYDDEADAAYILLSPSSEPALVNVVIEDDRVADELVLDFTESGELLGMEILGATKVLSDSLLRGARAPGQGRFRSSGAD